MACAVGVAAAGRCIPTTRVNAPAPMAWGVARTRARLTSGPPTRGGRAETTAPSTTEIPCSSSLVPSPHRASAGSPPSPPSGSQQYCPPRLERTPLSLQRRPAPPQRQRHPRPPPSHLRPPPSRPSLRAPPLRRPIPPRPPLNRPSLRAPPLRQRMLPRSPLRRPPPLTPQALPSPPPPPPPWLSPPEESQAQTRRPWTQRQTPRRPLPRVRLQTRRRQQRSRHLPLRRDPSWASLPRATLGRIEPRVGSPVPRARMIVSRSRSLSMWECRTAPWWAPHIDR